MRQEQDQEHAPHPAETQSVDGLVAGGSFGAAVPTEVVVVAIPVFFAIAFVMFFVEADEVEGETVVAGDKVDGIEG